MPACLRLGRLFQFLRFLFCRTESDEEKIGRDQKSVERSVRRSKQLSERTCKKLCTDASRPWPRARQRLQEQRRPCLLCTVLKGGLLELGEPERKMVEDLVDLC